MSLITALILGFLSSWHCIGMCGPLVMSVHSQGGVRNGMWVYNGGRILTYGLLGVLLGAVGMTTYLLHIQQYFAFVLGIMVLIVILKQNWLNKLTAQYYKSRWMKFISKKVFNKENLSSYKGKFFAGMANGLLPCGLVYVAFAGALSQPSVIDGMWYMLLFGLGTFPAMMLTTLVPVKFLRKPFFRKWAFAGMLIISGIFFFRALGDHTHHFEEDPSGFVKEVPVCTNL